MRVDLSPALSILLLILASSFLARAADDPDVSGPIVKLSDVQVSGKSNPVNASAAPTAESPGKQGGIGELAAAVTESAKEVVREVDKTLIKEFGNGTSESKGESFAAALSSTAADGSAKEEGKLETVVRISGSSSGSSGSSSTSAEAANSGSNDTTTDAPASESSSGSNEKQVDRIIDQHDNEFVLSKPGSDVSVLTLDPQLITDLTVVLVAAAGLGAVFECMGQPTINGYLIAGAMVGPGGLQLVKELVQVESIAQLGVYMLLFGLGMELNLAKIRSVLGVSVIGGSLQIILAMVAGGAIAAWICDSPVTPGVFIGALLAMSSTSVVVKCLEATKSMHTAYGTITVGTLILQDMWVGLLFALMPIFKPQGVSAVVAAAVTAAAAGAADAAAAVAAAVAAGEPAGSVTLAPGSEALGPSAQELMDSESSEHIGMVIEAIVRVLLKILLFGGSSLLLAKVVLVRPLRLMVRHASSELNQMVLVGVCLGCTWVGGWAGISEELGAFLGGVMVSVAAGSAAAMAGPPLVLKENGGRRGGSGGGGASVAHSLDSSSGNGVGNGAFASSQNAYSRFFSNAGNGLKDLGPGDGGEAGLGGAAAGVLLSPRSSAEAGRLAEELQHALRHNIDSVHNVLTALFLASTAIIISPKFLLLHVRVLTIGTILVMTVKTLLVAGTVSWFGHSWRISLAVGVTMSHVGEFAFVLLSTSAHLNILPPQVYQLLLGITALSLLATPLVIIMCSRLLKEGVHVPLGTGRVPLMADAVSPLPCEPVVQKGQHRWIALGKADE